MSTIIKNKLAQQSGSTDDADKHKVNLNKDALLAFVESAKIFISYLTATANDICHESKRQIINVDDVFTALEVTAPLLDNQEPKTLFTYIVH